MYEVATRSRLVNWLTFYWYTVDMTIKEALDWAKKILRENEVEGPGASAEFLLHRVLAKDKVFLITNPKVLLTSEQEKKYRDWVEQRSRHKPVWYITGSIEFLGQDFEVNENVLIPRPETELLIEMITEYFRNGFKPNSVVDIGTGSGAIILSLANILSPLSSRAVRGIQDLDSSCGQNDKLGCRFYASDISEEALKVAKLNASKLGFLKQIEFGESDLFSNWENIKFDLIVANLPYIPHEDMATLAFDLIHYEPRVALDGGAAGLDIYHKFFEQLPRHLNIGAKVFLEIGYDQGILITKIVQEVLPKAKVQVLGDYSQVDRIVIIET